MSHPHCTGCPDCHAAHVCNYCGEAMDDRAWWHRCTQGRCSKCHSKICTPGGATYPGHGSGLTPEQVKRAIVNEREDHGRLP